jgi:hypothetical protein
MKSSRAGRKAFSAPRENLFRNNLLRANGIQQN